MDPEVAALVKVAILVVGALVALVLTARGAKVEVDARRGRFTIDNTKSAPKKRNRRPRNARADQTKPDDRGADR